MAVKDKFGLYRGNIGEFTFRVVNGKQVVQQRPTCVKQTKRTKQSSNLFGISSSQSAVIRNQLKPWLDSHYDSRMAGRFLGTCYKVLKSQETPKSKNLDLVTADMTNLKGFEFNLHSPLKTYFKAKIMVEETPEEGITVRIPSFNPQREMQFPVRCIQAEVQVVGLYNPFTPQNKGFTKQSNWTIHKSMELTEEFIFNFPPNSDPGVTLLILQILFFKNKSVYGKVYLNHEKLHPMQIIHAK